MKTDIEILLEQRFTLGNNDTLIPIIVVQKAMQEAREDEAKKYKKILEENNHVIKSCKVAFQLIYEENQPITCSTAKSQLNLIELFKNKPTDNKPNG